MTFVTWVFGILFFGMIGYMSYYLLVDANKVSNNAYNVRLQDQENSVYRGKILASDGEVLAQTILTDSGEKVRQYTHGPVFAHVIGYSTVGMTGVEKLANQYLLKADNSNILQDLYQEVTGEQYVGCTVVTTLDTSLQETAYSMLGDNQGAVVALDPSTGKILAMVSKPDYDPNTIRDIWEELINSDNGDSRLVNRATQGLYPPGSTFKLLTALEYLRENPDYDGGVLFNCTGELDYNGQVIHCSEGAVHGPMSVRTALEQSCNGFFATIGATLSPTGFRNTCEDFLFNEKLPVDFEYKKSSFSLDSDSSEWDQMQVSFGQGTTLATPLQMALVASSVANGGTMMTPYVLDSVLDGEGNEIKKFLPKSCANPMTAEEAEQLKSYMTSVVSDGTGYMAQSDSYQAAGKTGSAEYDSTGNTHAWFIGFAPAENPQIAVAVIVEGGGSGGHVAAPIAKALFDNYLLR